MSPVNEPLTEFERNARKVLEESVARIDARTRSRLNQARHAALEAGTAHRPVWWRSLTLMPTAGAAVAALLVAVVLWHREPAGDSALPEGPARPGAGLGLPADSEARALMGGSGGPLY